MNEVEKYLSNITDSQRKVFEKIRTIVNEVAPGSEESISYGIPTFKYKKRPLIYFGAFSSHMSVFPASDAMVEAIEGVGKYRTGKGTLQFNEKNPIPDSILKKIILFRKTDIEK